MFAQRDPANNLIPNHFFARIITDVLASNAIEPRCDFSERGGNGGETIIHSIAKTEPGGFRLVADGPEMPICPSTQR